MQFSINREKLLQPLSLTSNVVEKKQTMAVLSNLLVVIEDGQLTLTGSDLEVEISATISLDDFENGRVTVPARKMLEVVKNLPDGAFIHFEEKDNKVIIKSGKARFLLASLSADNYPLLETDQFNYETQLQAADLKLILDKTSFAIALQDVRFFLNGLLFEFSENRLRCVATDGHRLSAADLNSNLIGADEKSIVVPRKGVYELMRSIDGLEETITLKVSRNHIQLQRNGLVLTSKLIDGKFPDYEKVIPSHLEHEVIVNRIHMIEVLRRAAILSNEKFRGVRVEIESNMMRVSAHNPEREEAKDELAVEYQGETLIIGFNFAYLLDALAALNGEKVKLGFKDGASSCLITEIDNDIFRHVVMPIKL
ncbi:MAG: DNA polymerase III subunit beta [bacterium]